MYNHLIRGTKRKYPATTVYQDQQDTTIIAGSANETENQTDTDTIPATSTANVTGTADIIFANGTNETTADRPANENVADENNEMNELTRGRLIALGRFPKESNKRSDVWKHIKQLGDMDPKRLENDNNQTSTH